MTVNDLEPPKGVLVNFSELDSAYISTVNCDEMPKIDQDKLHMKVLVLNANFSSPSADPPRFKEAYARKRQRGVPL